MRKLKVYKNMVGEFMMNSAGKRGMGWIPDYPDFRDYTEKTEEVKTVLEPTRRLNPRVFRDPWI